MVRTPRLPAQPAPILMLRPHRNVSTVTSIGTKTIGLRIRSGSLAGCNSPALADFLLGPTEDSGSAGYALAFVNLRQSGFTDNTTPFVGGYPLEWYHLRPLKCSPQFCTLIQAVNPLLEAAKGRLRSHAPRSTYTRHTACRLAGSGSNRRLPPHKRDIGL